MNRWHGHGEICYICGQEISDWLPVEIGPEGMIHRECMNHTIALIKEIRWWKQNARENLIRVTLGDATIKEEGVNENE